MQVFLRCTRLLALLIALSGCSSHMVKLDYKAQESYDKATIEQKLVVGQIVDSRGTATNWLGAIRGGYGNPVKKIYSYNQRQTPLERVCPLRLAHATSWPLTLLSQR